MTPCHAPSGRTIGKCPCPRALPWAFMLRPFGPECTNSRLVPKLNLGTSGYGFSRLVPKLNLGTSGYGFSRLIPKLNLGTSGYGFSKLFQCACEDNLTEWRRSSGAVRLGGGRHPVLQRGPSRAPRCRRRTANGRACYRRGRRQYRRGGRRTARPPGECD